MIEALEMVMLWGTKITAGAGPLVVIYAIYTEETSDDA